MTTTTSRTSTSTTSTPTPTADVTESATTESALSDAELAAAAAAKLEDLHSKANDVLEPKGDKIVLLTASDGKGHNSEIKNLFDMVMQNRAEYCAYHGYTYQFTNISDFKIPGRPVVWAKLPSIQNAFDVNPNAEWVWWLDTDAIIMTPELDLASQLLDRNVMLSRFAYGEQIRFPNGQFTGLKVPDVINPDDIDIIISQDYHGVNAGSIFFRRSAWTVEFLKQWLDPVHMDRNYERLEQDALSNIIIGQEDVRKHIGFVPQRLINAYATGGDGGFMRGDLVVHFAGCWVDKKCDRVWTEFWNRKQEIPA
ncbi:galactosyl transferase GMA12/MNN10 family-domain-containing protein, partial [Limtongia smithiae]|uniref:galactosyl transferase GMA12/MNN10 family-domain-containing protein n=1 Tax=Limtongia smithiae TaxID=1125753 RepID=UPI0034CDAD57